MDIKIYIKNKGFTLLEMIVSLGIFSVVAIIAVGSLVRITSLNRQAQTMQAAMNNINYILESMSREMRFGSDYNCDTAMTVSPGSGNSLSSKECNSNPGTKAILFHSAKVDPNDPNCNLIYAYWFDKLPGGSGTGWNILKSKQSSCEQQLSKASASSLIDQKNVFISDIKFSVTEGAEGYSWATIRVTGYAGTKEREKNYFDIRTGISQRIKDI